MSEYESDYAYASFQMPNRGGPEARSTRRRTLEECVMSREDRQLYAQRRPERLAAREADRKRLEIVREVAQLEGIPSHFGGGCGIQINPEYHRRIDLAKEVYDNGCQAIASGECGPCESFETKLCHVLGEITLREEQ